MKGGHTATQNRTRKNTRWSHTIQVRITHGSRHTSFSTNTTAFHFVLAILTHEVGVIEAVIARAIVEIVAERLFTPRALLTLLCIRNWVTVIVVAALLRTVRLVAPSESKRSVCTPVSARFSRT